MNGQEESSTPTPKTVDQRYEELLTELDRQQNRLGLPARNQQAENEATSLLDVTRTELRGMSAEQCEEAAILLQQFSFHIQRWQNRCQSTIDWCEANIKHIIAPEVGKMPGYSLEERRPLAVRGNTAATKLQTLKVKAEGMATDIAYLSTRVENQARRFADLAKIKVKHHG